MIYHWSSDQGALEFRDGGRYEMSKWQSLPCWSNFEMEIDFGRIWNGGSCWVD